MRAGRRTDLVRVHPNFKKLIDDSDMTSRDFTKVLSDKFWEEKLNLKKKGNGRGGFVI